MLLKGCGAKISLMEEQKLRKGEKCHLEHGSPEKDSFPWQASKALGYSPELSELNIVKYGPIYLGQASCFLGPLSPPPRSMNSPTASTRLLALPWNCLPGAPAWLGTVRETGRVLRAMLLPPLQAVVSSDQELQWMDGKLLLSFSLDSAPSSRRVGMGCRGLRLPGVTGGVGHGLGNVVGEWLLCRRGLKPATANACG